MVHIILLGSPSLMQLTKQLPLQQIHHEQSSSLEVQAIHPSIASHTSHDVVSSLNVSTGFSEAFYPFLLCSKPLSAEPQSCVSALPIPSSSFLLDLVQ